MREIKFRGRHPRRWAYGIPVIYDEVSHDVTAIIDERDPESTIIKSIRVNPETIGQYTGMKDMNGKEIYEGDIVRFYDDVEDRLIRGSVSYHNDWCSFNVDVPGLGDPVGLAKHWQYEVIGNIHDNPELLKH